MMHPRSTMHKKELLFGIINICRSGADELTCTFRDVYGMIYHKFKQSKECE